MDNDIFDTLYRRYYAPALLYAQGLCRSRHLAEDLVQEAFCRAWLSLPDDVPSFRGWLFRVLRNLLIDHQRRQSTCRRTTRRSRPTTATPGERAAAPGGRGGAVPCPGAPARRRPGAADAALLRPPDGGGAGGHAAHDPCRGAPAAAPARTRLRQNMEEDGYGF